MSFEKIVGDNASLEERIKKGILSPEDARRMQNSATGTLRADNRDGWVVDMTDGTVNKFENQVAALEWTERTGGLILGEDGEVAAGEKMDDILARINKK